MIYERFAVGARVFALSCLALCASCGGGGDSGGSSPPPPPPPPPVTGIGTAGGTVTEASGAKVVVPAGALAAQTDIAVTQSSAGAPALPAGVTAFGPIYAFTPHGTAFAAPVTITVPFDPTQVPAGSTPALYKTDATLSTWTVVSGATIDGATMSGEVTGFSDVVVATLPPVQLASVRKDWFLGTGVEDADELHVLAQSNLSTGDFGEVVQGVEYGTFLTFEDHPAESIVFSSADGKHYYLLAWAPNPGAQDPENMFEADSDLSLEYTYLKNSKDATLKIVISNALLDTIHPRGVGGVDERLCNWLPFPNVSPEELTDHCVRFQIDTEVSFTLAAWSQSLNRIFYEIGGSALLSGMGRQWSFDAFDVSHSNMLLLPASEHADPGNPDSEVFEPLWTKASFAFSDDFAHDGGNEGHAALRAPITVNVPLGDVPVGSVFTIEAGASAAAINRVQGESEASAFLRDPQDTGGGVTMEFTGLEPLPAQRFPVAPKTQHACTGAPDPAAGKVQFSAADFAAPELRPGRAHVFVERVDGTTGEIGVQFETQDGTALAGSDYARTRQVIWFHDGQDGKRAVTIPILFDSIEESSSETASLKLTVVSGCAALGDQATATLTIFDDDKPIPVTPTFALGGTVSGLTGSGLSLRTNFSNDAHPSADGSFTFARREEDGTTYSVTIESQPTNPAQICTLTNGSGTIASADVTDILVNCATPPPASGLDLGFGAQGKVFLTTASAHALAQQSDGKLLALGGLVLTRFNADGTPDTAFGSGGKVDIVTNGSQTDKMNALVVQPDGKIIVVGYTSSPTVPNENFVTLRFNADGTEDSSFGLSGRLVTDFEGHFDRATAVLLQRDGKIVVVGQAQIEKVVNVGNTPTLTTDQDFAALRYLPDGALDRSFGTDGKATVDAGGNDYVNAAALQLDGGIVIVGRTTVAEGTGNPDMAVARLLTNGVVDPGFGIDGTERIDFASGVVPGTFNGGDTDEALDVAIQADGKILVAGYALTGTSHISVAALFRLSSSGALDQNIGPSISSTINRVNGIALQHDGRIVIAGTGNDDFGLQRFTVDGALDTRFGLRGLLTVDFFGGDDEAFDVLIQSDGSIVAGGLARNGTGGGAGLARVLP